MNPTRSRLPPCYVPAFPAAPRARAHAPGPGADPGRPGQDKEPPIRIGEINSYKAIPAFLGPYKKGWQLALEQVNAEGGVLGRKLEVISRDDNGNPGDSVRAAQELLAREKVELLFGGFLSNTGLALTDFAKQQQVFFLAAEPLTDKITWQEGNRYTYRLRPSTWMHVAALAPRRWPCARSAGPSSTPTMNTANRRWRPSRP